MELREVLTHFQGVKKTCNGYMAKCPCHNDNQQSLSITENNDRILINCFTGCRTQDIVQTAGLQMKDLFNTPAKSVTRKPESVEYMYTDTLKKVRFYKWNKNQGTYQKCFCWKHKDNSGQWKTGTGKNKVPLYNQHKLSATAGNTVYIVEGEKDVETMSKLNFIAVSAPNGASKGAVEKKWNTTYNPLFKGLSVAIIPDNDESGIKFAEAVATQLLPFTESVKIINLCDEWTNLKSKGDITDVYENETPIKDKTIAETVKNKLEALTIVTKTFEDTQEPGHHSIITPVWAYEDKGEWKVNERLYITEFVKNHNVKCINNQLYSIDGVIEDGKAKQIIIKEILSYVKTNHGDKAEKLLKGIKQYYYCEPPEPDLERIHFRNGTLKKDINGLFTEFTTEKEFCINRIDTKYNPSPLPPKRFFEYLNEVYYEDDIKTLQQYCGYCLLPTTALQIALVIIGNGGEGKSVLGTILNALIGENNCYNASIKDLEGTFGVANVENKLIYIDDDISEQALTNSGIFKSLVTSQTTIEARKKFQQSNTIKPYIRFLCFGNFSIQSLYDTSDGFYRRLLPLRVKPKDKNRLDNPFLDREIIKNEADGVIKWAVDGLNELIQNDFKIFISDRTKAEGEQIKHENDSVTAFLHSDYITVKSGLKSHTAQLYSIYCDFCDDNAYNKLTSALSFSKAVKNRGAKQGINHNDQIIIHGKRARGFYGIGTSADIK